MSEEEDHGKGGQESCQKVRAKAAQTRSEEARGEAKEIERGARR